MSFAQASVRNVVLVRYWAGSQLRQRSQQRSAVALKESAVAASETSCRWFICLSEDGASEPSEAEPYVRAMEHGNPRLRCRDLPASSQSFFRYYFLQFVYDYRRCFHQLKWLHLRTCTPIKSQLLVINLFMKHVARIRVATYSVNGTEPGLPTSQYQLGLVSTPGI